MEKYQRIWDDAIDRLKSNISQQSFDMFFSTPKKVYKVKNNFGTDTLRFSNGQKIVCKQGEVFELTVDGEVKLLN